MKTTMLKLIFLINFLLFISTFSIAQTQIGMDIDGETYGDRFGQAIDLNANGNSVVVSSLNNHGTQTTSVGSVRIYDWNGLNWNLKGLEIDGVTGGDKFGYSVGINHKGDIVAIGARDHASGPSFYNAGQTQIYKWNGITWSQLGLDITGASHSDKCGFSIDLNAQGNRVVTGSPFNSFDGYYSGHVRIFEWDSLNWIQLGQPISGENAGDRAGGAVRMSDDGNRVVIGAIYNDGNGHRAGNARVFSWNGTWQQLGQDIDGDHINEQLGYAVDISGDGQVIAVAAKRDSINYGRGKVKVYSWNGIAWIQKGQTLIGEDFGDDFGYSVSINADGSKLAVGAIYNSAGVQTNYSIGHVRNFHYIGNTWVLVGQDIDGENVNDYSGWSVALDSAGNSVAIGAVENDGNGINSGHARVFDVSQLVNVNELQKKAKEFSYYPNPFKKSFQIKFENNLSGSIKIYDIRGSVLYENKFNETDLLEISLSIPSGVYLSELILENGEKVVKKLIRE